MLDVMSPFSVRDNVLAGYQIHTSGALDPRFLALRLAFVRGHLTLREATEQKNFEVALRRFERSRAIAAREGTR